MSGWARRLTAQSHHGTHVIGRAVQVSIAQHSTDLLHRVADMVINHSDAWEVELGCRDRAGQDLEANCQEATRDRAFLAIDRWRSNQAVGPRNAAGTGGWDDRKSNGQKRDTGKILPVHGELDRVNINGRVNHQAAWVVSVALLQHQLYVMGWIARHLHMEKVPQEIQTMISRVE